MNILYVDHYAGSSLHGMELRPYYLAREWVKNGHRVTIVAASFAHVRSAQPEKCVKEVIDGIEYYWLRTPRYKGNGFGRMMNVACFVGRLLIALPRIAANAPPDVVIASSTYPFDIFPLFRFARRCNARLVWEVHDLWPLSLIELHGMKRTHPFIMLVQAAENYAIGHCDSLVSILPLSDKYFIPRGLPAEKYIAVPNGVAALPPLTTRKSPVWKDLANLRSNGLVVGYFGSHGVANNLEPLIHAVAARPDVLSLVMVGAGPLKDALVRLVSTLSADNIHFYEPVSPAEARALASEMDCNFIALKEKPIFSFGVSPNKLHEYMMAGKPVISAIKAGNDWVKDSGCGLSIDPDSVEAIQSALDSLLHMSENERNSMGARGKAYAERNLAYKVLAESFLAFVTRARHPLYHA
ncbi:MAG: glycosyltransferase family 4 protein [Bdellovibrionota bacterium]|nr:MAG: glycosyltransferase family 4 protein [Bdellovibrionota bacterium]